jgi:molybdate transport system ATP-binding protein
MLRAELDRPLRDFGLDVTIEVEPGRTLALAGPSGAGKTTVLRAIAGLVALRRGRVTCDGETWVDTERDVSLPPERRACGLVFQDYALFPHLNAWRNVAYALRDVPRAARRGAAVGLLDRFGAGHLADAHPAALSGGERQRVALARALARRPAVLLLDEPLAALDAPLRAEARRTLAGLVRDAGIPAVLVTHDFTEAAVLADSVAVIDRGRILQRGTAAELASAPASPFVAELTGASVLEGDARRADAGLTLVALSGGGAIVSTDAATGPVSAIVRPWDVALEPLPDPAPGSTAGSSRNRIVARVTGLTPLGNHVRVGLALPQPLTADVTAAAAAALGLAPGATVAATFKATATRLLPR